MNGAKSQQTLSQGTEQSKDKTLQYYTEPNGCHNEKALDKSGKSNLPFNGKKETESGWAAILPRPVNCCIYL